MALPGEAALVRERTEVLATMRSLTHDELRHGRTLCEGWSPVDVLVHLIGVDDALGEYVRAGGRIATANRRIVEAGRELDDDALLDRAEAWAERPTVATRLGAWYLLGDVATHHQDVLRGLGRQRSIPPASRAAILREGMVLGAPRLLRYRVVPTDGGRAAGRGRVVRGTSEALGLWLSGRRGLEDELTFVEPPPTHA